MFTPKQTRKVFRNHIDRDPRLQPREGLDEGHVTKLMEAIQNGAKLPPIALFEVNGQNKLAGGRHRDEAYGRLGIKHIEADIYEGTFDDAWLFSRGDNNHGKPLNNEEKNDAVEQMLLKPELTDWSDRMIAGHVGVTHPFVGKVRKKLSGNGFQIATVRTVVRGGTTYQQDTANIGSNKPDESAPPVSSDEFIADSNPSNSTELEPVPEAPKVSDSPPLEPVPEVHGLSSADDESEDEDPFADEEGTEVIAHGDVPAGDQKDPFGESDPPIDGEGAASQESETEPEKEEGDTLKERVKKAEVIHDTLSDKPKEVPFEEFRDGLSIWRVLHQKQHKGIALERDLRAAHKLKKALSTFAFNARRSLDFEAAENTPFGKAIIITATMPTPEDWQVHAPCRGEGCAKCGFAGYDTSGAGISPLRVESGEVAL